MAGHRIVVGRDLHGRGAPGTVRIEHQVRHWHRAELRKVTQAPQV